MLSIISYIIYRWVIFNSFKFNASLKKSVDSTHCDVITNTVAFHIRLGTAVVNDLVRALLHY